MPAPEGNTYAAGNEGGAPSKYKGEYAEQVGKLCRLGATDKEIADFFGVCEATVNNWKLEHEEFLESIKKGKLLADANVADSLYRRALGYSHPDTHISSYEGEITVTDITKHYPPDATSIIFWLKNRQPKKWRDKVEVETSTKEGARLKAWTAEEIDAFEQFQQTQSPDVGN